MQDSGFDWKIPDIETQEELAGNSKRGGYPGDAGDDFRDIHD